MRFVKEKCLFSQVFVLCNGICLNCTDALTIYSLYTVKKIFLQEIKQIFFWLFFIFNCSQNSVELSLNELLGCYFQYYDISFLLGLKGFCCLSFVGYRCAEE